MKRCVFAVSMALATGLPFAGLAVEYFADAVNGSDSYDGTAAKWAGGESTVGPKKTVQAAVNLVANGDGATITLLPGVYDEGGAENTGNYPQSNRVVVTKSKVTIRSSTGKAKDVHIVGRKSTAAGNNHGIGEGAMRCLAPNKNVLGVVAVGITFRDGAAITTESNYRGGGIWGNNQVTIIDCVVSNCAAARGGGANSITAHSSLFTDNYVVSQGAAMYQSSMANCLIIHNSVGDNRAPLGHVSKAVNCTVARNGGSGAVCQDTAPKLSDDKASSVFYNTLVFGHRGGNGITAAADAHACVFEGDGTIVAHVLGDDVVTDAVAAEECASPTLGDWRSLSTGHCANRGVGAYLGLVPLPEGYTYHDMAGNEIDTNSTVTVGAFQEVVTPAAARIVFGAAYEIEGSPYPRWGTGGWITPTTWPVAYRIRCVDENVYALYFSEEYTSDGKSRIFLHSQYDGWTTIAPWQDTNATNTMAKQSFARALHVNPDTGNDDYDGSAAVPEGGESTVGPKKTLQGAVNAIPSSGYTMVYAAPGIYREGGTLYNSMSNRVCDVGSDGEGRTVGFVATGGPGSATIVGAPDPETKGLGDNAMRCVHLTQKYSFLQGFNITGGYTVNDTDKTHTQYYAAGANMGTSLAQMLDCTVTNNHAGICGGVCNGTLIRCRIIGNFADGRAAGTRASSLYRCIVDGNVGPNYHVELFPRIDSCFIGPNAKRANGTTAVNALYNCTGAIVNSLVLIPTIEGTTNPTKATNCVFIVGSGIKDENIVDCILTNLSAVAYDENYRPIVGSNVGIDRADDALSNLSFLGLTDLSGAQGVMNGARDLGALEADWRPKYAADLDGRCTVSAVSPEIRENAEGHVYLPSGTLEGTFAATSKATRRNLGVRVTGNGLLTVTVAGEVVGEFTANGGDVQNMMLALSTAGDAFSFAYVPGKNDVGGAEIVECSRLVGSSIVIR